MQISYLLTLIALFAAVGIVAYCTNLVRNPVFNSQSLDDLAQQQGRKNKAAYSLSKTQLAFWSIIVIASYIYVAFFTSGNGGVQFYVTMNAVNLTLLGIAAGTTVIGNGINASQQNSGTAQQAFKQQNMPSKGFFMDVISDDSGVSIHRLQNVIWTFVIGVVYIAFVSNECRLPDDKVITDTLLGLMGVSSVAYLGIKTQENKALQPAPKPNYNTPNIFPQNKAITPLKAENTGGPATSFSIAPPLPANLQMDPSTGVISGSTTGASGPASYVITVTNAAGSCSQTITITVK